MDIRYDADLRLVWITARGPWPNGVDHKAVRTSFEALQVPADAIGVLIDLRAVDSETAPHFAQIAFRSKDVMSALPGRRAYLVKDGIQFGVARMIQATAPKGVELEVFMDETEAVAWLLKARRA